jgi:hypothetical protein
LQLHPVEDHVVIITMLLQRYKQLEIKLFQLIVRFGPTLVHFVRSFWMTLLKLEQTLCVCVRDVLVQFCMTETGANRVCVYPLYGMLMFKAASAQTKAICNEVQISFAADRPWRERDGDDGRRAPCSCWPCPPPRGEEERRRKGAPSHQGLRSSSSKGARA